MNLLPEGYCRRYKVQHGIMKDKIFRIYRKGDRVTLRWYHEHPNGSSHGDFQITDHTHHPVEIVYTCNSRSIPKEFKILRIKTKFHCKNAAGGIDYLQRTYNIHALDKYPWFATEIDHMMFLQLADSGQS